MCGVPGGSNPLLPFRLRPPRPLPRFNDFPPRRQNKPLARSEMRSLAGVFPFRIMTILHAFCFCCSICVVTPQFLSAAEKARPATFVEVVQGHFDRWAPDNVLSAGRIKNLIIQKNPRITGDAAAALVAIHKYQLEHNSNPITKEFLLRPPKSGNAAANFEDDFRDARKRITTPSRDIF